MEPATSATYIIISNGQNKIFGIAFRFSSFQFSSCLLWFEPPTHTNKPQGFACEFCTRCCIRWNDDENLKIDNEKKVAARLIHVCPFQLVEIINWKASLCLTPSRDELFNDSFLPRLMHRVFVFNHSSNT